MIVWDPAAPCPVVTEFIYLIYLFILKKKGHIPRLQVRCQSAKCALFVCVCASSPPVLVLSLVGC